MWFPGVSPLLAFAGSRDGKQGSGAGILLPLSLYFRHVTRRILDSVVRRRLRIVNYVADARAWFQRR